MNLTPDDPRLTAYLLGELSGEERKQVEHAVASDPALRMTLAELEQIQKRLVNALSPTPDRLLPRQREAVLNAARHADALALQPSRAVPLPVRKAGTTPWKALFGAAAAAAAVIGVYVALLPEKPQGAMQHPHPEPARPNSDLLPLEVALLPAPGPTHPTTGLQDTARAVGGAQDLNRCFELRQQALRNEGDLFLRKVAESLAQSPVPQPSNLPTLVPRSCVNPADQPTMRLPVHAGRSSLGWVVDSIRNRHQLPSPQTVRIEEMLHAFDLRPTGITAVSSGVSLAVEPLVCPWKPSAVLALVALRCGTETPRQVLASYQAHPGQVSRYRLLGFSALEGIESQDKDLPTRMPGRSGVCLAIEIEPTSTDGALGEVSWSVDGTSAPSVSISRPGDTEPTDDARFAALVCTFGQWLAKDPNTHIDAEIVAALNRENTSDHLPADRSDFIHLVSEAIHLSAPASRD